MTFIAGIVDGKSCTITADNMVTFGDHNKNIGRTSSGQVKFPNMNDSVFKLYSPLPNCIASFAGAVPTGICILESLKSIKKIDSKDHLSTILSTFQMPKTTEYRTIFLIGLFDRILNKNSLFKWDSFYPDKLEEGNYFIAGIEDNILKINPQLLTELINIDKSIQVKGAALSFYYNQKLFHSLGLQLNNHGVGGCFFSISLNSDKFIAQDDTAILKIELKPKGIIHIPIIKLAYREGILFVNSSINNEKKAVIQRFNCSDKINKILDKHPINLKKYLDFDLEEIWDIRNVKNIEIHFEFDNIPSVYLECNPGQYLSFGETKTDVKINNDLEKIIEDCITKAR